ncbi:nucleoside 2-deoxyribosyltransferase [Spirulina sp. CS-785/01]|nr:nucleoside 2-deoxyribosyltransferase [Spirulina sp. CS-785/01]
MLIYLAAPLFSLAEQQFNLTLAQSLRSQGFTVFLPQQECTGIPDTQNIYSTCLRGLQNAQVLVAILDGADADSGTCWECGYAVARNIPVIALRTDFRNSGDTQGFNAMLYHSATVTLEGSENLESRLVQAIQHLRAELE